MKVNVRGVKKVAIKGDYIKLDSLLKFASLASTGGEAKYLITSGEVFVNGKMCAARGRKVRDGDVVRYGAATCKIVSREKEENGR